MKQLVVLSGKGGTGKTSIVAALATLAQNKVLADCDVDAANLHIIIAPRVNKHEDFYGSKIAVRDVNECIQCDECRQACRSGAIGEDLTIDAFHCEGCGVCAFLCPTNAIELKPRLSGCSYSSSTRDGPMSHATLRPGEGNSGKLVSLVKQTAQDLASQNGCKLIIIDGSPGIGCPVIASLSGTTALLVVIEPTLSGIHDLGRVLSLARHFQIRPYICINKYDINEAISQRIEKYAQENELEIVGRVPYSDVMTDAMKERKSIIEYSNGPVAQEIKQMWNRLSQCLGLSKSAD
jgi:MinD superfamily P-loop ATPase